MNSKRSIWKLLLGVSGVGLLVTNCTLKTATDDGSAGAGNSTSGSCSPVGKKISGCVCAGSKVVSYQVCEDEGIYGACVCAANNDGGASSGGASNGGASNGGATSAGATSTAGKGGASASAGTGAATSDAGAGGEGPAAADDCYTCLSKNCAPEWAACAAEDENNPPDPSFPSQYCLSTDGTMPGQIELIMDCILTERSKGPQGMTAKRDVVRACGSTMGASANPNFSVWAPDDMTPATEALMNCMADAPDEVANPGAWATDPKNYPNGVPAPWDAMTCAKDSCTSAL